MNSGLITSSYIGKTTRWRSHFSAEQGVIKLKQSINYLHMKEYYPAKSRLITAVIPIAMLVLLAFSAFSLTNIVALSISLILFAIIGYILFFLYKHISRPILVINNNEILVNTFFSNQIIKNLKECKLIISNDFVAFREYQKQDVSIGKDHIEKKLWVTLLNDLQSLPFKEIVK